MRLRRLLFPALAVLWAGAVEAATLTVDTTSDNVALSACTAAAADCSLRGAISASNALAGPDTIEFNIPTSEPGCSAATGICRIEVASVLEISQGLTIDGYTQPGAQPNSIPAPGANNAQLKIEIVSAGFVNFGLALFNLTGSSASPFSLRGLAITLPTSAIVTGGVAHDHRGNWFCVDALGQSPDFGPPCSALDLSGLSMRSVRVGGPDPADRNVIAGGGRNGAGLPFGGTNRLRARSSSGQRGLLILQGNLIGLAPDGITALPMRDPFAVDPGDDAFQTPDTRILDNRFARAQRSSADFGSALQVSVSRVMDDFALIQGNVFGLGVDGSVVGVEKDHIRVDLASSGRQARLLIGGLAPGEGNTFAGGLRRSFTATSLGSAVYVLDRNAPTFIEFVGNRMLGNDGIGLDLPTLDAGNNQVLGRTPNDADDADVGPNNLQNFPTIAAYSVNSGQFDVTYRVDAAPANSAYPLRVDFYKALGDEGEVLVGSDVYALVNAQQDKSATLSIPPGVSLGSDDVLVAIATDAEGRSSEFSFDTVGLTASNTPDPAPAGVPVTVEVTALATTGPFKPNGVVDVSMNTSPATTCTLTLAPTAVANTSSGQCQLVPVQAGTRTLTISYRTLRGAFGSATGTDVVITRPHTVGAGITTLQKLSGDLQSTPLGEAFAQPLVVRTLGSGGAPVAGIPVSFSAPASGPSATLDPVVVVSGADGLASTTATATGAGGSYAVAASVGTLTQSFSLTNTPGLASALEIVSNLPNPSNPGQPVTVTIALPAAPGGPAPSGAVAVSANTGEACTITLPATSCALTFASLGERVIQAFYPGDASYTSSKAAFATQQVQLPPSLRIDSASANEGDSGSTALEFTVTLDHPDGSPVSVDFASADDSAVAPGDYTAVNGTLNFSGATTTQTITVLVSGDSEIEPDERFFVQLFNASGASIADDQGLGIILNDDAPPVPLASISDAAVQEPVSGGLTEVLARFVVSLDRPAPIPVSVRVQTVDGSASAGADYDANDFRLDFAAGEQQQVVDVFVRDDGLLEGTETFTVQLSDPQGVAFADSTGLGSIVDGGPSGRITVTSSADPGDGSCTPAECTLREAITLGNSLEQVGIGFAIPGAGPHTIRPLTPLPIPAAPIHTIDGYSQPGSSRNTLPLGTGRLNNRILVELDGGALGAGSNGLVLQHGVMVSGLAIHGWSGAGIRILTRADGRPTRVFGNFIGTRANGTQAAGNGTGIEVEAQAVVPNALASWEIGIPDSHVVGEGNLISGNLGDGIVVRGGSSVAARSNQIWHNRIGVAATGAALGNGGAGLRILTPATLAIHPMTVSRNTIAGNAGGGLVVRSLTPGGSPGFNRILVQQNDFGIVGQTERPNGGFAIDIGAEGNDVTGLSVLAGNRIFHGSTPAVRVLGDGTRASVALSDAPVAAVDLGPAGPTPNDPGDGDSGPNELLNTPEILSAEFNDSGERVRIRYQIDAPLGRALQAQFHAVSGTRVRLIGTSRYLGGIATAELGTGGGSRLNAASRLLAQTINADRSASSELSATPVPIDARQALASARPVREGPGAFMRFQVRLDSPIVADVTLRFATESFSARSGIDFEARAGSITLTAAAPTADIDVPVLNDGAVERTEFLRLRVWSDSNPGIGTGLGFGAILDDDVLRRDRSQYTALDLDGLNGIEGFRIDHPRGEDAMLLDVGDFDGSGGRELLLGLAASSDLADNPSSLYLLPNLAPPFAATLSIPVAGSSAFPRIVDEGQRGAGWVPATLGRTRGAAQLPSIGLRNGDRSLVLHGRATPLPASSNLGALAVPPLGESILGESSRVVPIGDFNGDGRTDFGVMPGRNGVRGSANAFVVYGSSTGLPASTGALDGSNGFELRPRNAGTGFFAFGIVFQLAPAGDVDGDGRSDLLVHAFLPEAGHQVVLVTGRASAPAQFEIDDGILVGGIGFPGVMPMEAGGADLDGDGHGDLVIAPQDEGSAVRVIFGNGSAAGFATPAVVTEIHPAFPGDRLGGGLALLPDLDGNGIADLALGMAGSDLPNTGAGGVALLYGRRQWPALIDLAVPPADTVKFLSSTEGSRAGWRLAPLGDLNGDGLGELAISAPAAGRSYVLFGNDGVFNASAETQAPDETGRAVYRSVDAGIGEIRSDLEGPEWLPAGDVDGDGRGDLMIGWPESFEGCVGGCSARFGAIALVPAGVLQGLGSLSIDAPPEGSTRWLNAFGGQLRGTWGPVGDFDGDGRDDLAFTARSSSGAAQSLSVVFGGDLPASVNPFQGSARKRILTLAGRDLRIARLGDIDGDGFDDIGVLKGTVSARVIEVIYGIDVGETRRLQISAPAALQPLSITRSPGLGRIVGGGVPKESFEIALGDGRRAVMLSAPAFGLFDLGNPGTAALFLSAPDGLPSASAALAGLGDLDGDGIGEFGVARPRRVIDGQPSAQLEILRGRSNWPTAIDVSSSDPGLVAARIALSGEGTAAVSGLDTLADRNGDGRRELLVVLGAAEGHAAQSGKAFVIHTPALAGGIQVAAEVEDEVAAGQGLTLRYARFAGGRWAILRNFGDFDGDGVDDLVFGAEAHDAIDGEARFGSTGILRGSALPQ